MSNNEFYSQVNVPFSWELKPGVSKVTSEDSSIDISHFTVKLAPPPCLSKSDRFCVNNLQGVLNVPPCQLRPKPTRSSAKKGNVNSQDDPFVAAYRKCTEQSADDSTDDENDASSGTTMRTRKNICTLSCKYSCTVSSDNVVRVSQCLKEKAKADSDSV
ncbi:hypothetical protein ES319_D01G134200v1 [Gossypium barbadense]|uniref:Uncharacterized protein n=4 Tax=Gossypium TaxID=3633 RepID=A0A5J5SNJ8_GOSBA|nr:hypothetical protein ES319_D01G134200v1 [Gossypium barbadense]PPD99587.1 hypothetical protein GOBAR_DD03385 [Gossypium barbadense]TYG83144.1 hypothetical protein ES288_D01G145400v1 [Gossypium darwinii]TYH87820.1 hypothetical protein ES332_D01G146000v1 [Gossypium tomentosum]